VSGAAVLVLIALYRDNDAKIEERLTSLLRRLTKIYNDERPLKEVFNINVASRVVAYNINVLL